MNHISASTGEVIECKYSMLINGDDIEVDWMNWKYVSTVELDAVDTPVTVDIPSSASEIYIEYGSKDDNQIYGGGTLTLVNGGQNTHPCFVPVYNVDNLYKIIYFYYYNDVLTINMRTNTDTTNGLVAVYYR